MVDFVRTNNKMIQNTNSTTHPALQGGIQLLRPTQGTGVEIPGQELHTQHTLIGMCVLLNLQDCPPHAHTVVGISIHGG